MIDKRQISKLYAAAKLSETERDVLEYLLNNIDTIQELGIRAVAQACFTSMTTVMRLSKKLGYSGYREMVYDLTHLQRASQELGHDLKSNAVHFSYQLDSLKLFIDALRQKRLIGLNGEGFSRIVAEYMTHKLAGMGFKAVMQDFLETDQFLEAFSNEIDCMVLVSKSGQTEAILEMARACQSAGVLSAAFTGNAGSELASAADIVFIIQDDHPFDLKNVKPNCFSGYCILAFEELLSLSLSNLEQEGFTQFYNAAD